MFGQLAKSLMTTCRNYRLDDLSIFSFLRVWANKPTSVFMLRTCVYSDKFSSFTRILCDRVYLFD